MDFFQQRYYKINKLLLSTIGQWPYQSRGTKRALLFIYVFLAASQIIPQIIAVVEFRDDPNVIIESISPFVIDLAWLTKLVNIYLNSDKMFQLAECIQRDWMIVDEPEIYILHEYANAGRAFTIGYAGGVYIVTIIFMMQPALPKILSTLKIVDNNVTGEFPFPVDYYGLDLDRYYYYLLLHSVIAVTSILTVISAADTMFIVHVQHACAMFTIVGRRLERMSAEISAYRDVHVESAKDSGYRYLAICIERHKLALKYSELLEASYTWGFFSLVGFNMIVMSITGFQTVVTIDEDPEEAVRYAAFTFAQMIHLFFQSYFSQRLMDHSEKVRDYLCQAEWYKTSLPSQKLLNLITMRTYVPCQLTAGGFFVMSLENFTSIVKTSMSYFTLLRSMQ